MSEEDKYDAAVSRVSHAEERKRRALERKLEAEREAEATSDPQLRERHLKEAAAHVRAAELHEQAERIQRHHAAEHRP